MRVRAARPDARFAVLEARSDPVPERADLLRAGDSGPLDQRFSLRAEADRILDAGKRRNGRFAERPVSYQRQEAPGVSQEGRGVASRHAVCGALFAVAYGTTAGGRRRASRWGFDPERGEPVDSGPLCTGGRAGE